MHWTAALCKHRVVLGAEQLTIVLPSAANHRQIAYQEIVVENIMCISASDYQRVLAGIMAHPQYLSNLDWGKPRRGHPEGTLRAHIAELERNLVTLRRKHRGISDDEATKLRILIYVHDIFKPIAKHGPILSRQSHASLAANYIRSICSDWDLEVTAQYHDAPFAMWHKSQRDDGQLPTAFARLLGLVRNWDLFIAFAIIDGCTSGKQRKPLSWFLEQIVDRVQSRFSAADVF